MNYFDKHAAAVRYSEGRPDFHSNTISHIKSFLHLDNKVDKALDIACGTGLSTKALLEIANEVYGTDISEEMLKLAPYPDQINYSLAPAEQQPFPDNYFHLVTVSSGVHWFDIDRFLLEANRLLKSGGWLVLYENHFIAEMIGHTAFTDWFLNAYLRKFPSPPRNNSYVWTYENLMQKNFNFVKEEKFKNAISLNKRQLVLYFTTQSNVISAVERNEENFETAEAWLNNELNLFYKDEDTTQVINYGNWIKYIQRAN
jgi:ubiquinone/menaquinone biosynthesis C-methylase UbiE